MEYVEKFLFYKLLNDIICPRNTTKPGSDRLVAAGMAVGLPRVRNNIWKFISFPPHKHEHSRRKKLKINARDKYWSHSVSSSRQRQTWRFEFAEALTF